jgi:hypothetical protein
MAWHEYCGPLSERVSDRDDLNRQLRAGLLAGAEQRSQRDHGRGLTDDEIRRTHTAYPGDLPCVGVPDVYPLRVDASPNTSADHFCPLCHCLKSGWESDPNPGSEWCEDPQFPCHDEELPAPSA